MSTLSCKKCGTATPHINNKCVLCDPTVGTPAPRYSGAPLQLKYGSVIVPWTVSWSSEEDQFYVGVCEYSGAKSLLQKESRGVGTLTKGGKS